MKESDIKILAEEKILVNNCPNFTEQDTTDHVESCS